MDSSPKRIVSAFMDTSVLYAAIVSASGASREILRVAFEGAYRLFFSSYVFAEVERNLASKAPDSSSFIATFRASPIVHMCEPSIANIRRASATVVAKDAPIVAAAMEAGVDYLLTFDRRHVLSERKEIFDAFGIETVLPEEFLARLRH